MITGCGIVKLCQGEISRQRTCIIHDCRESACIADTKDHNCDQCDTHNNTLYQISGTNGAETAHQCVAYDDKSRKHHSCHVVCTKQTVKKLSAGSKAGCGIWNKKDHDDKSSDCGNDISLIMKTFCKEIRNGDRLDIA